MKASDPRVRDRVLTRYRLGLTTKAPIGAGSFTKGSIMLVGERTSHPERNKYHAPFCSILASSGWLNALLEEAMIPEDQLFWVNALDNDGTDVDLRALADAIEPRCILALGNVAKDKLTRAGLVHECFTHPQYHKRFKNKEEYLVIKRLQELVNV